MGLKIGGRIEKVNGRELTYSEFAEKYMSQNQPVLLTGLMDDWRACKDWVSPNGKPNLHFFSTHFGKSKVQVRYYFFSTQFVKTLISTFFFRFLGLWSVTGDLQVADCGTREFTDQKRIEMTVSEFVDRWLHDGGAGGGSLLYLKDWHFVKVSTLGPLKCEIAKFNVVMLL